MSAREELIGKRFGRLTVIGEAEPHRTPGGKSIRRLICKCDCGKTVTVLRNELSRGRTSCGCERYEKIREDLTGKRFGRLEAVKLVVLDKPTRNGIIHGWLCKCDCGNEVVCTSKQLNSGKKTSCGCAIVDALKSDNRNQRYDGTIISAIKPERKANINSKTGVKGVYWSNREQCYIAKIGFKGKSIMLGRFHSLVEAKKARQSAEEEYYEPIIKEYKEHEKSD